MRTKPFTVIQNGKPIFTVHAYSLEQAKAQVAATVPGETVVDLEPRVPGQPRTIIVAVKGTSR